MNPQIRKELVKYRINRANETLKEVEVLIENQFWNASVNRIYYACYYAVTALLVKNGIKAQTHAGTRQMFGLHFIKSGLIDKGLGRFYSDIFDKRQTGDYDDFIIFDSEEVTNLLSSAKNFILEIEKLLELHLP